MIRVSSSESVSFDADPESRLVLKLETGVYFDNRIRVRAYPSADVMVSTAGAVNYDSNRFESFVEGLRFQGADTSQLRYPSAQNLILTNTFATVDANLVEFSPVYEYDINRDSVRVMLDGSPVEAYGAVQAAYSAPYQRYLYQPQYEFGILKIGSIIARRGKTVAVLSIDSDIILDGDYVEIYRVVSDVLVDSSRTAVGDLQSAWEVPPGYPDNTAYPGSSESAPDSNVLVDERVHEYGYVNRSGRIETQTQFIRYEFPYNSPSTLYRPEWRFTSNRNAPPGHETAFGQIPWSDIESDIRSRYSGITI